QGAGRRPGIRPTLLRSCKPQMANVARGRFLTVAALYCRAPPRKSSRVAKILRCSNKLLRSCKPESRTLQEAAPLRPQLCIAARRPENLRELRRFCGAITQFKQIFESVKTKRH